MPKWKHPMTITYADGSRVTVSGAHLNKKAKPRAQDPRPTGDARRHWLGIKRQALKRDQHRCVDCGRKPGDPDPRIRSGRPTKLLEVHHLTYERYGQEFLTDVVTLCQRCHSLRHVWAIREGKPLVRPRDKSA